MIRTPLRPLARILSVRARGGNPDLVERENLAVRNEQLRDKARGRAESRLYLLGVFFVCAFATVGLRMGAIASSEPVEPVASVSRSVITSDRAQILDRRGRILATNLQTFALYAQPPMMVNPEQAVRGLVSIFPDLDGERLLRDFTGKRKFVWVKKQLSPEQMQAVQDIGEPGLLMGSREMRLYPMGRLAAHVLGGWTFGTEGVRSAELIGVAGVEKAFDTYLRDPANDGRPLELSIDSTVQYAAREVLEGGMKLMNAKAASAVLMDVRTGEVISMISLPDFDPNERPLPLLKGSPGDSPLFNRAVQGVYELGSVFKIFTAAQAMDLGLVTPSTMVATKSPMVMGKFKIRDFSNYGAENTVTDIIVKSSNIGAARLGVMIGAERQQAFLAQLGLTRPTPIELVEGPTGRPLVPERWSELSTMTIAYGHGIATSPLHLAAAYATIANGGRLVTPTLLRQSGTPVPGEAVIRPEVAAAAQSMLRQVVTRGTASFGEVPGYAVGGKTGTADKPKPGGGYYEGKVLATFASMFPANDPQYVLIVSLDEPYESSGPEPRRTAGWTAVPVAAEMIRRIAPLLGLRPEIEPGGADEVTLARN